jgi:predicted acetyltransferase
MMPAPLLAQLDTLPKAAFDDVARLASQAFGIDRDTTRRWIDKAGPANWRLLRENDTTLACLLLVPMGLYLGGRRVEQQGIAGVAVGPEARGRGIAGRLMAASVLELHDQRVPISTLYSAMHPLYRKVGFDTAGVVCKTRLAAGDIPPGDRGAGWHAFDKAKHFEAVRACYERFAAAQHGALARGPYIWDRVERPRGATTESFFARGDDDKTVEAYVFYRLADHDPDQPAIGTALGNTLIITDTAWSTPRGMQRLLGFLRGFSSVVGEIVFHGPLDSPLLLALPDRRYRVRLADHWMLRITHLQSAIEQRGYPLGLAATLDINLADDTITAHNGRWRITLDGSGRATCKPGGDGSLALDARTLAMLYTGHMTATQLAMAGRVRGKTTTLRTADAIFGGFGQPSMADMF